MKGGERRPVRGVFGCCVLFFWKEMFFKFFIFGFLD